MALEFYRDSVDVANKVDDGVFAEIHKQALMFDKQFKLGSTVCMSFTIKTSKAGLGTFDKIIVREGNSNKHILYLDSVDTSDDVYDTYVLCDSMLKFNKVYDGSTLTNDGQTSVTYKEIIADICSQMGVDCLVSSYRGPNRSTTTYDNTTPARDYISWFAELNGGFAYINASDKLKFEELVAIYPPAIAVEDCSSFKLGAHHVFTRVVFDNYDVHYEEGYTSTGTETLYLNPNNRYIIDQSDVEAISNRIGTFDFYNIKVDRCPIPTGNYFPGYFIKFSLNGVEYKTVAQIDQSYNMGWQGGFECWLDNAEQVETQVIGTEQKIRKMEVKYDLELNQFSRSISDLNENVTSTITQTADTIREDFQKEIKVIKDDVTKAVEVTTYIQRTADGLEIGLKSEDPDVDTTVRMQLTNESLNFINNDNEILASLDAQEGLVASKLAVGSPTEGDKRWQFIVWGVDNTHLRIAKHT